MDFFLPMGSISAQQHQWMKCVDCKGDSVEKYTTFGYLPQEYFDHPMKFLASFDLTQSQPSQLGAVEYTDCISAEVKNHPNKYPGYDIKPSDSEAPGKHGVSSSLPMLPK